MLQFFAKIFSNPAPILVVADKRSAPPTLTYAELAKQDRKPVLTGVALLQVLDVGNRVASIRELMALPEQDWRSCCLLAIERFCEAVQLAPASEVHHHAFCGGLIVHTLDALEFALKRRRKYQLPAGAGAELVNERALRWTYGVFCGVLLHDPGKVGSAVQLLAEKGEAQVSWSPLQGSMVAHGISHYRIAFDAQKAPYKMHNQMSLALFSELIPEAGRQWLGNDPVLLGQLFASIYDVQAPGSGAIGEIVLAADQTSVRKNLGQTAPTGQKTGARGTALVDKYIRTLRQLLADGHFTLNRPGAQVFITGRRQDTDADRDVWILCRAAAEAIVAALRPVDSTVPSAPERVYDTLQEHAFCELNEDKAIWKVAVHQADWRAEFAVLKFKAWRLFGAGRVPARMDGSVKPLKLDKAKLVSDGKSVGSQGDSNPGAVVKRPTPDADVASQLEKLLAKPSKPKAGAEVLKTARTAKSATAVAHTAETGLQSTLEQELADMLESATPEREFDTAERADTSEPDVGYTPEPEIDDTSEPRIRYTPEPKVRTAALGERPTSEPGVPISVLEFFNWLRKHLDKNEPNLATSMVHGHVDGILMVSPLIFRTCASELGGDWTKIQKEVNGSGYILTDKRRHVHRYTVQPQKGSESSSLACTVVLPAAVKALLKRKIEPNPSILARL